MHDIASYLTTAFAFLTTVILSVIGWGLRSQIQLLRAEFQLSLAQFEIRFFATVNGTYVRKEMLELRLAHCSECQAAQALEREKKAG